MGIVDGITGAISGGVNGLLGNDSGGGGGTSGPQVDFQGLADTFQKATDDTAQITKITTEGNVAKDGAAQRPR